MYQIIHAGGIDSLNHVTGLEPTAGIVVTAGRTAVLSASDLEAAIADPRPLLFIDGEVLWVDYPLDPEAMRAIYPPASK